MILPPHAFVAMQLLTPRPAFQEGSVRGRGVYHPLLLEPALEPLKEPPATEPPAGFDATQGPSPSSSAAADSFGRASWEAAPAERKSYGAKGRRGQAKGQKPCPVDLLVPPGATLVNVTGPNTGMLDLEHTDGLIPRHFLLHQLNVLVNQLGTYPQLRQDTQHSESCSLIFLHDKRS